MVRLDLARQYLTWSLRVGYSEPLKKASYRNRPELADYAEIGNSLEVGVLISADIYWNLITGDLRREIHGPTAICSKVNWILAQQQETASYQSHSFVHLLLQIDSYTVEQKM